MLMVGVSPEVENALRTFAERANFSLASASTGTKGMGAVQASSVDLALVDCDLPDIAGLAWLKMVRQTREGKELPVIVTSARRTDSEVAEAFEWGADDFVELPCVPEELLARLRAVLRRRFERDEQVGYAMSLGPVSLDPAGHQCRVRGKALEVMPREFELLEILMRKAGRVLSRSYLLEAVWGMSRNASTRAVDVGISRLRRALGPRAGRWVETVERYGYRYRNPSA